MVDQSRKRVYYLPLDPEKYDAHFASIKIPGWRCDFKLGTAVEEGERKADLTPMEDCEPALRIAAGTHRELVNLRALQAQLKHFEFLVRFGFADEHGASRDRDRLSSYRVYVPTLDKESSHHRLETLRAYVERLQREAIAVGDGIFSLQVGYFRVSQLKRIQGRLIRYGKERILRDGKGRVLRDGKGRLIRKWKATLNTKTVKGTHTKIWNNDRGDRSDRGDRGDRGDGSDGGDGGDRGDRGRSLTKER